MKQSEKSHVEKHEQRHRSACAQSITNYKAVEVEAHAASREAAKQKHHQDRTAQQAEAVQSQKGGSTTN